MTRVTSRGFSLIEILVVLFIIGITLGFALLSFGDFGEKRRIIVAAEQLTQYIKLVQQYAILETSTLRLQIKADGYQVFRFQPPKTWSPIASTPLFRLQHFPKGLLVNGRGKPLVIQVDASGDMTAFTLTLGSSQQPTMVTIVGKRNGAVTLQHAKSP
ncbi:MAG TPA: type II secretion system protein GspH [Legionella sp.]|nr:type II secretion system protein GspH [Legionella sp.]